MSKWLRLLKIGALITGTVLAASALEGGVAGAEPPIWPVTPTEVVVTLPAGCTDHYPTVKLAPTGQPAVPFHGFMNARCGSTNKIFYLQYIGYSGWKMRTTPYTTFDNIGAVAVDSTGTYVVFDNSQHQLMLGKRMPNGSFMTQQPLGSRFDAPNHPSIIAQNGNYWVVWDDDFPHATQPVRRGLWETKTIGVHVTENPVGKQYHEWGALIHRNNGAYQLFTFDQLTAGDPSPGLDATGRVSVSDRAGTGWTGARAVFPSGVRAHGSSQFADFKGSLYALADWQCGADTPNAGSERMMTAIQDPDSPSFNLTELDTDTDQTCATPGATDTTSGGVLQQFTTDEITVWNGKYPWFSDLGSGVFRGNAYEQYPDPPANTVEVALLITNGPTRLLSQTDAPTTTLLMQGIE